MTDPTPAPSPGPARALGVLNLVFGLLLLVWGGLALAAVGPFVATHHPFQLDPAWTEEVFQSMRSDALARPDGGGSPPAPNAGAAPGNSSRERLAALRGRLTEGLDFPALNGRLPWVSRYLRANVLTGPPLNLALAVSGVGLVRRRRWGATLATRVAALKLVRLAALSLTLITLVVPAVAGVLDAVGATPFGRAFLAHAVEEASRPGAPARFGPVPALSPGDLAQAVRSLGVGYALMSAGLGAVYPLIVCVVLTRPGVRNALEPQTPPSPAAASPPPNPGAEGSDSERPGV